MPTITLPDGSKKSFDKPVSGKDIAAEETLQLVMVRSQANVLYANPKFDLTNRIIVAYDKKHP